MATNPDGISAGQGDEISQGINATANTLHEGLHILPGKENIKAEIEKLPPFIQEQLKTLAQTSDLYQDLYNEFDGYFDSQKLDRKEGKLKHDAEYKKQTKQSPKDTDLLKMPDAYALPSLFVAKTLHTLLGDMKSPLLGKLDRISELLGAVDPAKSDDISREEVLSYLKETFAPYKDFTIGVLEGFKANTDALSKFAANSLAELKLIGSNVSTLLLTTGEKPEEQKPIEIELKKPEDQEMSQQQPTGPPQMFDDSKIIKQISDTQLSIVASLDFVTDTLVANSSTYNEAFFDLNFKVLGEKLDSIPSEIQQTHDLESKSRLSWFRAIVSSITNQTVYIEKKLDEILGAIQQTPIEAQSVDNTDNTTDSTLKDILNSVNNISLLIQNQKPEEQVQTQTIDLTGISGMLNPGFSSIIELLGTSNEILLNTRGDIAIVGDYVSELQRNIIEQFQQVLQSITKPDTATAPENNPAAGAILLVAGDIEGKVVDFQNLKEILTLVQEINGDIDFAKIENLSKSLGKIYENIAELKITEEARKNLLQLKDVFEAIKPLADSFKGISDMAENANKTGILAQTALPGMKLIIHFVEQTVKLFNSFTEDEVQKMKTAAEVTESISKVYKGVEEAVMSALKVGALVGLGIVGAMLSILFVSTTSIMVDALSFIDKEDAKEGSEQQLQIKTIFESLAWAAIWAAAMIPLSIVGTIGAVLSTVFVMATFFVTLALSLVSPFAEDASKAAQNVQIMYKSLMFAGLWASAQIPFMILGIIGATLAIPFMILTMFVAALAAITGQFSQIANSSSKEIRSMYGNLLVAALAATPMIIFGPLGMVGALLTTLFLLQTMLVSAMLSDQTNTLFVTYTRQAGESALEIRNMFAYILVAELAAIAAGIFAIPQALGSMLILAFLFGTNLVVGLVYDMGQRFDFAKVVETSLNMVKMFGLLAVAAILAIIAGALAINATIGALKVIIFLGATSLVGIVTQYLGENLDFGKINSTAKSILIMYGLIAIAELLAIIAGALAISAVVGAFKVLMFLGQTLLVSILTTIVGALINLSGAYKILMFYTAILLQELQAIFAGILAAPAAIAAWQILIFAASTLAMSAFLTMMQVPLKVSEFVGVSALAKFYKSIFKAEMFAILAGVLAIFAAVAQLMIMAFVWTTIKVITLISSIDFKQAQKNAGLLKKFYSNIFAAEIFAILAGVLQIPAALAALLVIAFIAVTLVVTSIAALVPKDSDKKQQQIMKFYMLIQASEVFAIIAGMLQIAAAPLTLVTILFLGLTIIATILAKVAADIAGKTNVVNLIVFFALMIPVGALAIIAGALALIQTPLAIFMIAFLLLSLIVIGLAAAAGALGGLVTPLLLGLLGFYQGLIVVLSSAIIAGQMAVLATILAVFIVAWLVLTIVIEALAQAAGGLQMLVTPLLLAVLIFYQALIIVLSMAVAAGVLGFQQFIGSVFITLFFVLIIAIEILAIAQGFLQVPAIIAMALIAVFLALSVILIVITVIVGIISIVGIFAELLILAFFFGMVLITGLAIIAGVFALIGILAMLIIAIFLLLTIGVEILAIAAGIMGIFGVIGLILVAIFFLAIIALGILGIVVLPFALILLVVGIILLIAFIAITVAAYIAATILAGLMPGAIQGTLQLLLWFPVLILVGALAIPALIAGALLLVAGIILAIAFVCLALQATSAGKLTGLLPAAILGTNLIPTWFPAIILAGALSIPLILLAAPLLAASIMLAIIFSSLVGAAKNAKRLYNEVKDIDGDKVRDSISKLYGVITIGLGIKSVKIIALGAPVLAAAIMLKEIFKSIVGAYRSIGEISEIQNKPGFDPEPVFKAVDQLVDIVGKAGDKMKGKSKKMMEAFQIGIGAVIDAINGIVNCIKDINEMTSGEKGKELIEKAVDGLQYIISQFFGIPMGPYQAGPGSVLKILDHIKTKMNAKQLNQAQALVPITEAIGNITDTIVKIEKVEDVKGALGKLEGIKDFVVDLIKFVEVFQKGGLFQGPGTAKLLGIQNECMEPIGQLVSSMTGLVETIAEVSDPGEAVNSVYKLIDLVGQILALSEKFKGGGFFSKGSEEQFKIAASSINGGMRDLVRAIVDIGKYISDNVQTDIMTKFTSLNTTIPLIMAIPEKFDGKFEKSSIQALKTMESLKPALISIIDAEKYIASNWDDSFIMAIHQMKDSLPVLLSSISKFDKNSFDSIRSADIQTRLLGPILKRLQDFSKSEFNGLADNIEEGINKPLLALDPQIQKLAEVKDAITTLNTELSKLKNENKETLKGIAAIGEGNTKGINLFVKNLNKSFSGGGSTNSDKLSSGLKTTEEILAYIAEDVHNMKKKMTNQDSWAKAKPA